MQLEKRKLETTAQAAFRARAIHERISSRGVGSGSRAITLARAALSPNEHEHLDVLVANPVFSACNAEVQASLLRAFPRSKEAVEALIALPIFTALANESQLRAAEILAHDHLREGLLHLLSAAAFEDLDRADRRLLLDLFRGPTLSTAAASARRRGIDLWWYAIRRDLLQAIEAANAAEKWRDLMHRPSRTIVAIERAAGACEVIFGDPNDQRALRYLHRARAHTIAVEWQSGAPRTAILRGERAQVSLREMLQLIEHIERSFAIEGDRPLGARLDGLSQPANPAAITARAWLTLSLLAAPRGALKIEHFGAAAA